MIFVAKLINNQTANKPKHPWIGYNLEAYVMMNK